jgi:hypothetical protein
MNSIYGKSIMKDIITKTVIKRKSEATAFQIQQYNYLVSVVKHGTADRVFFKVIKPISKSWTLPQFGVMVLSWSKHLMNRVMCLAEQNGIKIFYQDTDSMHLFDKDVPRLGELFERRYHQKLIGDDLTQFHSDFSLQGSAGKPYSTRFIGLGKKSYLDILEDGLGHSGLHIRMKGIPDKALKDNSGQSDEEVIGMYERMLYRDTEELFDLTVSFRPEMTKDYTQRTRTHFTRRCQFIGVPLEFSEEDELPKDSSVA